MYFVCANSFINGGLKYYPKLFFKFHIQSTSISNTLLVHVTYLLFWCSKEGKGLFGYNNQL